MPTIRSVAEATEEEGKLKELLYFKTEDVNIDNWRDTSDRIIGSFTLPPMQPKKL